MQNVHVQQLLLNSVFTVHRVQANINVLNIHSKKRREIQESGQKEESSSWKIAVKLRQKAIFYVIIAIIMEFNYIMKEKRRSKDEEESQRSSLYSIFKILWTDK